MVGSHGRDKGRKRKQKETEEAAEAYDGVRFLTFTGNHVQGTPEQLCDRGSELAWLWQSTVSEK